MTYIQHSSRQCWILNRLSEARDRTHILMDPNRFINHWATKGTPFKLLIWPPCPLHYCQMAWKTSLLTALFSHYCLVNWNGSNSVSSMTFLLNLIVSSKLCFWMSSLQNLTLWNTSSLLGLMPFHLPPPPAPVLALSLWLPFLSDWAVFYSRLVSPNFYPESLLISSSPYLGTENARNLLYLSLRAAMINGYKPRGFK